MCVYSGRERENRLWGTGVPISMAVLVRKGEFESSYRDRKVLRPARHQAKSLDIRSRLETTAEVGPALAGAGTVP